MALAVIPCRPHSRAAVRVSAAMPALAALYSPRPASPRSAASDTMLMMRPQPRAAMRVRAAHIAHHVPFTPLVHDRSNCSSGMSSSGARAPKPCALLTSTSTLPQRRTVSSTARSTSSRRPTSATSASASPPAARISCAVRSARCSFSSATHTRAPSRANRSAIPRPMPWPAPVTSATLAASRSIECAGLVEPALRARHRGASGFVAAYPYTSPRARTSDRAGSDGALALREAERLLGGAEAHGRARALLADAQRDQDVGAVRRSQADVLAVRAEQHAAVALHLEAALVEPAGETAPPVLEAVAAPVRVLPVGSGDRLAEERPTRVGHLQRGVLGDRVEERRHRSRVARLHREPTAPALQPGRPEGHPPDDARPGLPTAVRILVVHQAVAVIVDAVAALLVRPALGRVRAVGIGTVHEAVPVVVDAVAALLRPAARDVRVAADTAGAAVRGAGVPVVTVRGRGAGDASFLGRVLADAVRAAGVGGAGVAVAAVGGGGARAARRRRRNQHGEQTQHRCARPRSTR